AVGLSQYPGGEDYYRALVARTTRPGLKPEEIHRAGLEGYGKLNQELDTMLKKVGLAGTLSDFRKFLKSDPRFFARTPDEVGQRLMAAQNRIVPRVPEFFGRFPKAPYGVQRLEPELEESVTFGYYQIPTAQDPKGYYKYNGSHLSERDLIGAGSLISHELVPGHHFQLNLQLENTELPKFRPEGGYHAFVQGCPAYFSSPPPQIG